MGRDAYSLKNLHEELFQHYPSKCRDASPTLRGGNPARVQAKGLSETLVEVDALG